MAAQKQSRRVPAKTQDAAGATAERLPAPDTQAAIQACKTATADTDKLPGKLSDLIRLAVADAQTVAKMPGYRLSMPNWHTADNGTCHVCLAGAVIANTLGADRNETLGMPGLRWVDGRGNFYGSESDAQKLLALNAIRTGNVDRAVMHVYGNRRLTPAQERAVIRASDLICPGYSFRLDGGRAPWSAYLDAADALEKVGL